MKRFLVVGCGGSGGATIQYLMDQLREDLRQHGITTLPKGWQFVHVDVPNSPDGTGLPPTVTPENGGTYVSLTTEGAVYQEVASTVDDRLSKADRALAAAATWRPLPGEVNIPISNGAGQYRAVGRTIALAKVGYLRERLNRAWETLEAADVLPEMREVAAALSPSTAGQVGDRPVVLVLSSMAGGAGASMVLDLCRVMAQLPNYDPRATALLLYTPEVFNSLSPGDRTGVNGNAMAMMGELIAAQSGAGQDTDDDVLRAMGLPPSASRGVPFRRVIPIGSQVGGRGQRFGDGSLRSIYRGMGRGLAALMSSGEAASQFVAYTLGNPSNISVNRNGLGWGVTTDQALWGAFGFASLGLGRERYAEYAAQRLARAAVDQLAVGHLQQGDTRPGVEQAAALVDARWPWLAARVGLPPDQADVRTWFFGLVGNEPFPEVSAALTEVVDRWLPVPSATPIGAWFATAQAQIGNSRGVLEQRVDDAAYRWAHAFAERLQSGIEDAVVVEAAEGSLVVARAQLERVLAQSGHWVTTLQAGAASGPDVAAAPVDVARRIAGMKGSVTPGHALLAEVRAAHQRVLTQAVQARCAWYAAQILGSLSNDLVQPLADAVSDALRGLEQARSSVHRLANVAAVQTDHYGSWPDAGKVPQRFSEAHNEVLLTPADSFAGEFAGHMVLTQAGGSVDEAVPVVARDVVLGRWDVAGGETAQAVVLQRSVGWRAAALPDDLPRGAGRHQPPRRASYRLAVTPAEVLDRARAWVRRPGEAFHSYVSQSLRDFLQEKGRGSTELSERARLVVDRFSEVLRLAQPLVGVSATAIRQNHPGEELQYAYQFSGLPFGSLPLADDLRNELVGLQALEPQSETRFLQSLSDDSAANRIAVFGAYRNFLPPVYRSLLDPIVDSWSAAKVFGGGSDFWQWRRARRIPQSVPYGDEARKAMIGGWFVARFTGRLRYPHEHTGRTVDVYDDEVGKWMPFPRPFLTPCPVDAEWHQLLPAVLESSVVALAESCGDVETLLPYALLRKVYDESVNQPVAGKEIPDAARRRLATYVESGTGVDGSAPAPDETPEQRRTELLQAIAEQRQEIGRHYLFPGEQGAVGGGDYSELLRPQDLVGVPMFHEVAGDVHLVLGLLARVLEQLVEPSSGPLRRGPRF